MQVAGSPDLPRGPDTKEQAMRESHLEGAGLVQADLEGADLRGAHLEGAGLLGTLLEGADLGEAHLEGARADEHTSWPDGFKPGDHGAIVEGDEAADADAEGTEETAEDSEGASS
jgi:uncharacterized protein YjbI with pentapeptide repeats